MRPLDWAVLIGFLLFIVVYGVWRGRRNRDLDGYLLSNRDMRWYTIALAIMATQASAITFLSTPGQAYADGMRFIQFYLGLPLAMVVLSITAVPIYHRLKVYTAYEYLEKRFDAKTRTLAASLFLVQRGLACGLTIYAPAVILSVLMGWNLYYTNLALGFFVVIYTATGGTRAVNHTISLQLMIALTGMAAAFVVAVVSLPKDISFLDATYVAGKMGRLNAIDFSFDVKNRYNFWSGLIGGFFLALSYFGTDQSQVGRYLSGQTITQSRLGLIFNGFMKIPMQFFILFTGAMVFALYQFVPSPLFFNTVESGKIMSSPHRQAYLTLEAQHKELAAEKETKIRSMLEARRQRDTAAVTQLDTEIDQMQARGKDLRTKAVDLFKQNDSHADTNDTNYVFLTFILTYLPAGLVGLVIAAVFAASMSSTAGELNALSSTTVIDLYKRYVKRDASQKHYVAVSIAATFFWGAFAIAFAEYANRLGSLIEAVNILGSLFYGTILGIFLVAFYAKGIGGTATFVGAVIAEIVVIWCKFNTEIAFLWFNLIGCMVVVMVAYAIQPMVAKTAMSNER